MRKLEARFSGRDDIVFVTVYQREPHARMMAYRGTEQAKAYSERKAAAIAMKKALGIKTTILVDEMDDRSRGYFGNLPSPAVIIGPDGRVAAKIPWPEPSLIEFELDKLRRKKSSPEKLSTLLSSLYRDPSTSTVQRLQAGLTTSDHWSDAECSIALRVLASRGAKFATMDRDALLFRSAQRAARSHAKSPHRRRAAFDAILGTAPGATVRQKIERLRDEVGVPKRSKGPKPKDA